MEDCLEEKLTDVIVTNVDGGVDVISKSYNGSGEIIFDNNSSYSGGLRNGYFEGKGVFRWDNGVEYTGDFTGSNMKGVGQYVWPDESKYTGDIFYGKRHGQGNFDSSSNQHYEGEWRNGKRHGQGVMYYNPERTIFYKGCWKANMRHGFGCMTYASGNTYEGEWENDLKCGQGVMTWLDKSELHLGQWRDDLPNGWGEHIWSDAPGKSFQRQICNMYRGEWKDGLREGHGCFFYANGSQYIGDWEADMKHGAGKFINADNKIQYGLFENNRMVSEGADRVQGVAESGAASVASGGHALNSQRGTDPVNPQYLMNVTDVLCSYPAMTNKASHHQQTLDIQRLVLRYNTAIRSLIKKYTAAATTQRSILNNPKYKKDISHPSLKPPATWSALELLFFTRRGIHDKFFSISLQQLLQFARECDLIGPTMTAYDVCMCVKAMHLEHSNVAEKMRKEHLRQAAINVLPPPPLPEILTLAPVSTTGSLASERSKGNLTMRSVKSNSASRKNSSRSEADDDSNGGTSKSTGRKRVPAPTRNSVAEKAAAVLAALTEEEDEGEDGGAEEVKGAETEGVETRQQSNMSGLGDCEDEVKAAEYEEEEEEEVIPHLPLLLDVTFEAGIFEDVLFPIREREFVELMVRVIAEASCRKQGGVSGSGLFDNIYRIFAEIVEPLASESTSPSVFVSVLYAESVQTTLRRRCSQLRSLWDQVTDIARDGCETNDRKPPQVKHIIKLLLALRGTAIVEGSSVMAILEAVGKRGSNDDVSSLDLSVTFDDFVEMFCRVVVSDLWMFAPEQEDNSVRASSPKTMDKMSEGSTSNPALRRQSSSRSPVAIIENALAKRLSEWLKLI